MVPLALVLTDDPLVSDWTGELREDFRLPPDFAVDEEGATVGQKWALEQRLRVGVDIRNKAWLVATEWDLFATQAAGDPWDIAGTVDERRRWDVSLPGRFLPRKAGFSYTGESMNVWVGLTTSHWGLGMVANDGAHDPTFGRTEFGDRVLRFRVATRPGSTTLALAADHVIADDTASIRDGQVANQLVGAALYAREGRMFGVYGVLRHQTEADGIRTTKAAVLDAYAAVPIALGTKGHRFDLAAEIAEIGGSTSRSLTYNERDRLRLVQAGLAARAAVVLPEDRASLAVRTGWASGDGDPDDESLNDFTFDRDYDAGMVLFDEVGGAIEAATWTHLTDPERAGQPPDGVDATVTEGAFRRAVFVQPVLDLKPADWLGVRGGVMLAWATAPIANPYTTFRNGGVPTNHLGEATSGYSLGTELDWAVTLGDTKIGILKPALQVQGGHLFPSPNLGVPTSHLLSATARVRW